MRLTIAAPSSVTSAAPVATSRLVAGAPVSVTIAIIRIAVTVTAPITAPRIVSVTVVEVIEGKNIAGVGVPGAVSSIPSRRPIGWIGCRISRSRPIWAIGRRETLVRRHFAIAVAKRVVFRSVKILAIAIAGASLCIAGGKRSFVRI